MNIQISGYFDKNFGDDLMQIILTSSMPSDNFFVSCPQKEFLAHFRNSKNVFTEKLPSETDAFVNVIGTGFKFGSKLNRLTKLLAIPKEEKMLSPKTAVIDCSADMPENAAERFLVKRELNKYKYISCRDSVSEKIISEMAKKSIIHRHEDLVFALDESFISKPTGEDCLGIIPVQRGFSADNFEYYKKIAYACDAFFRKERKNVLLFALDSGNENDTLAALSIKNLMKSRSAAEIIVYNSDAEYIFKNIARCGKIISSRFHGVIAALLSSVSVAAISDTSKINLLSEKIGFPVLKKSSFSQNDLCAVIDSHASPSAVPCEIKKDAALHIAELTDYLKK